MNSIEQDEAIRECQDQIVKLKKTVMGIMRDKMDREAIQKMLAEAKRPRTARDFGCTS